MKEFIKNFRKQKTTGWLSIISLSLGTMVAIMIGILSINEFNFDNFHTDGDRIYRVVGQVYIDNNITMIATDESNVASDEKVLASISEIEQFTFFTPRNDEVNVEVDQETFSAVPTIQAKENFFSFFSFPLKVGDPETALAVDENVVIDRTMASRMFPGKDALGETVKINGTDMRITGVMYDIPHNSHIRARMIIGEKKDKNRYRQGAIYYKLAKGADNAELGQKLTQTAHDRVPYLKGMDYQIKLQPLKDIHFDAGQYLYDNAVKSSKPVVRIYIMVAVLILLLSCINFTNLFVSNSFLRAKSIGIKQVQGAHRSTLRFEFYRETAFYTAISLAIGLFLAVAMTPYFNQYTNIQLHIDFGSVGLYAFLLLLFVTVVVIAGSLPAFRIARMNPIETIKGTYHGRPISFFQKGLTIVQFTASIALLLVTLLIGNQVKFMQSQSVGFNRENIVYAFANIKSAENYDAIYNELMKEPSVVDVTMIDGLPVKRTSGMPAKKVGDEKLHSFDNPCIKPNYFDVMGMQMLEGENPFSKYQGEKYCVLNETAVRLLGYESPIDQTILLADIPFTIKGVIRNAQTGSFHKSPDPQVYVDFGTIGYRGRFLFLIKITGEPQKAIAGIEKQWKEVAPDIPFECHFLDEEYEKMYISENNLRNMLSYAMVIGFAISVAGLFAMALYSTQRRRKEIAIRKVTGATVMDLLRLLNKSFMLWIFIAFILGSLMAWFFMEKFWLKSFIVQAPMSVSIFVGVGLAAVVVALLTVSWQTWSAATTNPVKVIKE